MAYIELHDVVKDFKIKNRRNGAFGNVKNFFCTAVSNETRGRPYLSGN